MLFRYHINAYLCVHMKEGWEIKKIKDICDKASSNIAQNKIADIDGDYPVFGASGFVQNVDFYHRDSPYVGIVKDGAGVGRVNIYPAYSSLLGTLQYIIPKEGFSLEYVAYALKSLNLASFASGATIPHIYFKNYGEYPIPVPPLSEQSRIVEELDCLSGIIEKKRQQLSELDALAQSIFYEMFGDPVENDMGWEVKELQTIFKITSSKRILQSEWKEDGVPFYKVADVVGLINGNEVKPSSFIDTATYNELNDAGLVPKVDDILITSRGTLGQCYIISEGDKFYFQDGMITWLSPKETISSVFIKSIFDHNSFANLLMCAANSSTVAYISIKHLSHMAIPVPPLTLQQAFASKIEAIQKQKELISRSIKETETLLGSRMDYWFG